MLQGLTGNSKSEEGAKSLAKALDTHAEKNTKTVDEADEADGEKIVNHILGSKTKTVTKDIAGKTKLSSNQVMSILAICAPLLMSLLGNEKKSKGSKSKSDSLDMTSLLTSLIGGGTSSKKDNDGIDLGDIAGLLLKTSSSKGKSKDDGVDLLDSIGGIAKLLK